MNKKTLEHIDRFVDGVKWDILIKNNEFTFDLTLPDVSHLSPQKQDDLWYCMCQFLTLKIDPFYIKSTLKRFKNEFVSNETRCKIIAFINEKDLELTGNREGYIKETIRKILIHYSDEKPGFKESGLKCFITTLKSWEQFNEIVSITTKFNV